MLPRRAFEKPCRPVAGELYTPSARHERETREGLKRSDQSGFASPFASSHHVDAPVNPVREVDVGVAGTLEHDLVSLGPSAKCMGRRIALAVRLGLDDDAAGGAFLGAMDKNGAE